MIDQKDGWLAQVASENGLKFQSKSPAGEDRAAKAKADQLKKTYQSKLAEQENALRKARKKGEDPKRIARLEAQLEASRERWKSYLNPEAGTANEAATKTATLDLPKIIDQAYLRTLSRLPSEQERTAAEAYVAEAGNQLDGLRGVLWALVNTKEFIVNH